MWPPSSFTVILMFTFPLSQEKVAWFAPFLFFVKTFLKHTGAHMTPLSAFSGHRGADVGGEQIAHGRSH